MKIKIPSIPLAVVGLMLIWSTLAGATILVPGDSVAPAIGTETGTLVVSNSAAYPVPASTSDIYGTVTEGVYREGSGTLDFDYQFTNLDPNVGVASLAMAAFNNPIQWDTDVYFNDTIVPALFAAPGGANIDPSTVQRSGGTGKVVTFNFSTGGGAIGTSALLIIRTNARDYTPGTVTIQNGISQNLSGFFAPVPEPGFYGLLAIGLAITFVVVKYRKQTA